MSRPLLHQVSDRHSCPSQFYCDDDGLGGKTLFFLFHPRAFSALSFGLFFLYAQPSFAEFLSFEQVLSAALKNSFAIKISQENIQAGQAFVNEARSDYYPELSISFGNDYIHAFTEQSEVTSSGDVVFANQSSYRHSLITALRFNLFDFGVRRLSVENANRQVQISTMQGKQVYWDAHKEVLSGYSRALKLQKQIDTTQLILDRQNTIFRLARQLRHAGTFGREQIGIAALNLAETLSQLDDLTLQFQNFLANLTFYTRQNYQAAEVKLAGFDQLQKFETAMNPNVSPEVQIYQEQIKSKKAELSMVKRSMLPKLVLSGSHRMFGSHPDSFTDSLSDLTARDARISLTLEWPLFAGFVARAKRARLNHEINSLRYQKEKKKAELQQEVSAVINSYAAYASVEKARLEQLEQISAAQNDAERLADQQITDQISFHRKTIELARQRLDVELWQVDYATSALSLDFMSKAMQ